MKIHQPSAAGIDVARVELPQGHSVRDRRPGLRVFLAAVRLSGVVPVGAGRPPPGAVFFIDRRPGVTSARTSNGRVCTPGYAQARGRLERRPARGAFQLQAVTLLNDLAVGGPDIPRRPGLHSIPRSTSRDHEAALLLRLGRPFSITRILAASWPARSGRRPVVQRHLRRCASTRPGARPPTPARIRSTVPTSRDPWEGPTTATCALLAARWPSPAAGIEIMAETGGQGQLLISEVGAAIAAGSAGQTIADSEASARPAAAR